MVHCIEGSREVKQSVVTCINCLCKIRHHLEQRCVISHANISSFLSCAFNSCCTVSVSLFAHVSIFIGDFRKKGLQRQSSFGMTADLNITLGSLDLSFSSGK